MTRRSRPERRRVRKKRELGPSMAAGRCGETSGDTAPIERGEKIFLLLLLLLLLRLGASDQRWSRRKRRRKIAPSA